MSTKENPIDALIYESGIIAQGCFDKYDVDALKKFAELIVQECARVIDRGDGVMSSIAETSWCNQCRDDILKHFGVEQ